MAMERLQMLEAQQQPGRPTPTSVLSGPEPECDKAAARTADQTKPAVDGEYSSKYCYSPLSEQGSIRLLRLMPHEDEKAPLQCQVFEYPLHRQREGTHLYEALSYVWGSERNNRQTIYIQSDNKNNGRLLVTANLHTALLHLRDRFVERTIWIDAICINQKDNNEKGQQVQCMAKIYAKANRVVVWLGEAAGDSDQALRIIRKAAEEQHTNSAIDETNQQTILTLLERPWFQRIWVLQEVAAARQVLIKCGPMEIDGYAFCLGLSTLQLSYETCPGLQGLIHSVTYLIRGAIFRPRSERDEIGQLGKFSLDIRPLSELIDMYHAHKATERHDKVYALLGMCSDDPSAAGLSPNYEASWKEVFRTVTKFSLSNQMSVDTWNDKEVAVIKGKGCILGTVSSVKREDTRDDRQSVDITWNRYFDTERERSSCFIIPASAEPIQAGDVVCLLQGALRPTIVRLCIDFSTIITIAVPLTNDLRQLSASITTFPNDFLLVWDWNVSPGSGQGGKDYESFMGSRKLPIKLETYRDKATRLWNSGLLLKVMGRYEEARKNLGNAIEYFGMALTNADNLGEGLSEIADLLIEDKGGIAPLSWAAAEGHEAVLQLLLDKGAEVDAKDEFGHTPLLYAAAEGHEAVVRLVVDKGAAIEAQDGNDRTPLSYAAANGHEAVLQLLLNKGAEVDAKDKSGATPLLHAAAEGHEAVVRLLVDKGAAVEDMDWWGRTPLSWAAAKGHEVVVKLLESHAIRRS